jgi:hypothetical protein
MVAYPPYEIALYVFFGLLLVFLIWFVVMSRSVVVRDRTASSRRKKLGALMTFVAVLLALAFLSVVFLFFLVAGPRF